MAAIEEIRPDQNPTQPHWRLIPLYKETDRNNVLYWQIEFNGVSKLITYHGYVGGVIQTVEREVIPKSNRTMQQQALQEARQRYLETFRNDGYRPPGDAPSSDIEAMAAYKWLPESQLERLKAWEKSGLAATGREPPPDIKGLGASTGYRPIKRWPVATSAKIDGIRMLSKIGADNQIHIRSRRNVERWNLPYIIPELQILFGYLPANTNTDGEVWIPGRNFNNIQGILTTIVREHPENRELKYYIFDLQLYPENPPFEDRYKILFNAYKKMVEDNPNIITRLNLVNCTLAYSENDIIAQHSDYVSMGFEGSIIRKLAGIQRTAVSIKESQYKAGRGANILKYKDFQDEEGTVIGVQDSTGTEAGAAVLVVRDPRGHTFTLRMRGSVEERRRWLEDPSLVIGKLVNYQFQELSEYGVPRFPVGIAFRNIL